jgi:hypothetical protein
LQASRRLVPPSCILVREGVPYERGASRRSTASFASRRFRSAPGPTSCQGVLAPRAAMNTLSRNLTSSRSGHQTTGETAQRFVAKASSLTALSRQPAYAILYRESRIMRMRHRAETLSRRLVPPSCILVGEAVRRVQADPRDSVLRRVNGEQCPLPTLCDVHTGRQFDVRVRSSNDGRIRDVRLDTWARSLAPPAPAHTFADRAAQHARSTKIEAWVIILLVKETHVQWPYASSGERERTAPALNGAHNRPTSISRQAVRRTKEKRSSGRPKETLSRLLR